MALSPSQTDNGDLECETIPLCPFSHPQHLAHSPIEKVLKTVSLID